MRPRLAWEPATGNLLLHKLVTTDELKHDTVEVRRIVHMDGVRRPRNCHPLHGPETGLEAIHHQREKPRAGIATDEECGDLKDRSVLAGEGLGC
jgi:hypothetical protein